MNAAGYVLDLVRGECVLCNLRRTGLGQVMGKRNGERKQEKRQNPKQAFSNSASVPFKPLNRDAVRLCVGMQNLHLVGEVRSA